MAVDVEAPEAEDRARSRGDDAVRSGSSTLTGFWRLCRLILRRDRVRIPVWLVALGGIMVVSAASLPPVYPTQASIEQYVELFGNNPALIAFAGPGYGFDAPNLGVILVNETQLWGAIAVALMSIFLLNRHTRAEEDDERADLLRANVVGRHAPTAAAVGVVTAVNVVLALFCAMAFVAFDYAVAGSIALAGSFLVVGVVFVGVTAVAAQVASTGRATLAMASSVLGVAFVLRAIGDIADSWVRWLSPIGWAQSVRAFADEAWWTLGFSFAVAFALVVGAFWLSTQRDAGSGLLATRAGPEHGSSTLVSPLGLAVRLQRGSVIGWSIGLALLGALYGSIGEDVEQMLEDNPVMADFLAQAAGASITDAFFATSFGLQAVLASGFVIAAVLQLRTEEEAGRAELVLVCPTPRARWAAGHLVVAVVGSAIVVLAGGLGTGVAYAAVSGDASQVMRLTAASVGMLPGVWVLIGITMALFGLVARWALAAWGVLAALVVLNVLGQLLRLPDWVVQLSPFEQLPAVPLEAFAVAPVLALTAVAAGLVALGLWGLSRRDLRGR